MSWMAWTMPTAIFFAAIGFSLVLLTLAELKWPTALAKGFLPLVTTRGDRFFISLLSAALIHLFWLALIPLDILLGSSVALAWAVVVMTKG
jgi:predicted small integral membrane protein